MRYRFGETTYDIAVRQVPAGAGTGGAIRVSVDGVLREDGRVPLADDRVAHAVEVEVRAADRQGAMPLVRQRTDAAGAAD